MITASDAQLPISSDTAASTLAEGEFLEALEAQLDCYRTLEKLSREQARQVEQGDTDSLLETLQRRQEYLDRVADHERTLAPAKQAWPEYADDWESEARSQARAMFTEIKELLGRITSRDRHDMLSLQQQRMVVGHQIRRNGSDDRNVRRISQTYAGAAYTRAGGSMDFRR